MSEEQRRINIRRSADGSWTYHPHPPLAATSMFLTDGWAQIALLRRQYDAIDQFNTEDYEQFVLEFGAPPIDLQPTDTQPT